MPRPPPDIAGWLGCDNGADTIGAEAGRAYCGSSLG